MNTASSQIRAMVVDDSAVIRGLVKRWLQEDPEIEVVAWATNGEAALKEIEDQKPIADAVRGILDGHIVLDREIAERGRFPAIDILRSLSRTMPACNSEEENALVLHARRLMAAYANMEELIRLGAYRAGSDPEVDEAIRYHDALEGFLRQDKDAGCSMSDGYNELADILMEGRE